MAKLTDTIENLPSHYEQAKFVVTRNLFTLLTVILLILGTVNFIQNDINMYPTLAGGLVSAFVLWLLFKYKNYKRAAKTAVFLSLGLTIYNLMVTSDFGHFVDFFWIIVVAIYVFFTLGTAWGIVNLFVNIFTVVLIFYLVRTGQFVQVYKEFNSFSQPNFIINITLSGVIFSYIILLMINQMKLAEEKYILANSELSYINEEKTVMLKEIHHRVKNNLQVITSLLRLQANEIDDAKTKNHLADSVNRVSAMAMIHEKMYQSENLTKIDLKVYLNSLIQDLITSYADKITSIKVNINSDLDRLEPKSVVPLALIFNELVSNSIKHAFKEKPSAEIIIEAKKLIDSNIQIIYRDNGTWSSPQKESSFGLEMIETFTEQLEGQVKRYAENGTVYQFTFPNLL